MTTAQIEPTAALAELREAKADRVTIVLLSGDLDKAMAAFIIATGAAAMGMQVTVFFTFWGLNTIRKKGARSSATDLLRRMFGFLNKGGADTLPLSRFHFGGLGTRMMQVVMKQNRSRSARHDATRDEPCRHPDRARHAESRFRSARGPGSGR